VLWKRLRLFWGFHPKLIEQERKNVGLLRNSLFQGSANPMTGGRRAAEKNRIF
jgi:hypothetical protein